uniref:Uncharacterized protein n=1 Tax=Acrobeloides nanus TaxID=290746 RepID=A0A914DDW0_9BILA
MKFDLIIMDPPWSNKSVKRKKIYGWFDMDDLKALPISEILSEDGLLIIWLTNNKAVHENLTRILEHWDLKEITKWHWLK